jgi:hypothetical protein
MNSVLFIPAVVMGAGAVLAQPDPPPLSPAAVLAQVRSAHRAGPIADEVTVQLTLGPRRTRSASLVVRVDARDPAAPLFRIEFDSASVEPSLVAVYAASTLAAANSDNENDRWIVESPGLSLSDILAHLPPIPVPELRLALDADDRFDQPTPYTPDVNWFSAELSPAPRPSAPSWIVLRGQSSAGPVQAAFDASTLRFRSFHAELHNGTTELTLDLSAKPVDPGDPATWRLTTAGRRTVASLSDLAPQRAPIPVGDFVPDLSCTHANGSVWSLYQALTVLPAPAPGAPAPAVALVLFRTSGDDVALASGEASARLALSALRQAASPAVPLETHLIAAIDLAAYGEQWPALQQRWGAEAAAGLAPGWATPSTTIDRYVPAARAALVLIAPDRRLLAVTTLDEPSDAGTLAERIREWLRPPE